MKTNPQLLPVLASFGKTLLNQEEARVIVPAQEPGFGFWFGGGNMARDPDGSLWLVGRYRNFGDSRTGLGAGVRGLEMAIFHSEDKGVTWEKALSFAKSDLDVTHRKTLSIEGSALRFTDGGVEVFYSTECDGVGYPPDLSGYQKPGTGVWAIHHMAAKDIQGLANAERKTILSTETPGHLHIKDPFLWERAKGLSLLFCTHPYTWASGNTGMATRLATGDWDRPRFGLVPRGPSWDVSITRGTAVLPVPALGPFADGDWNLLFYDGGECMRNLDENDAAHKRPRGYSCEELGGLGCFRGEDFGSFERVSKDTALFLSPHGTGCSRYVDVLRADGGYYTTWQQSQADRSQPLVLHFTPDEAVRDIWGPA